MKSKFLALAAILTLAIGGASLFPSAQAHATTYTPNRTTVSGDAAG
jgi:hypothetical protein